MDSGPQQYYTAAMSKTVCVSKVGFTVAIAITAMLALVVVVVAYSCLLMLDRNERRRSEAKRPLPHPTQVPNPIFDKRTREGTLCE